MTAANPMQIATHHFQSGRMADAEKMCRQILAQQPNHADALHMLGIIAKQTGHNDAAVELFRKAAQRQPTNPDVRNNLGVALKDQGNVEQAIIELREAIRLAPLSADAYNNLGTVLTQGNENDAEAIDRFHEAIRLRPQFAEAFNNLGIALKNQGRLDEAVAAINHAIRLRPGYSRAFGNLGNALAEQDKLDESAAAIRQAIQFNPNFADAYYNLGNTLRRQQKIDEAIANYRIAIQLKPDYPEAHNNLGLSLSDQGKYAQAIAAYQQAIRLRPDYTSAYQNWGNTLADQGHLDQAIDMYQRAIAIKPDFHEPYYCMALSLKEAGKLDEAQAELQKSLERKPDYASACWLSAVISLMRGDFVNGWRQAEWRWKCKQFSQPLRNWAQPQWMGEDINGRTILLHAEQGFGDTVQFVRYAPLIAARGGKVILECQAPLERLMKRIPGIQQVITAGNELPRCDFHSPLLSLPLAFGTTLETIPSQVPYLDPDPQLIEAWRSRMDGPSGELKVGIAWAGSPTHQNDKHRSIKLAQLAPLAGVAGVRFYGLQKGPALLQMAEASNALRLHDFADDFTDFAETAAMIAHLDLVISVDTVIAHLAGAMGKRVWLLLPHVAEWRWMLDREDSPWYPTMRLFRQRAPGQWDEPVARMVEQLGNPSSG